jgi:hypothetical protein
LEKIPLSENDLTSLGTCPNFHPGKELGLREELVNTVNEQRQEETRSMWFVIISHKTCLIHTAVTSGRKRKDHKDIYPY